MEEKMDIELKKLVRKPAICGLDLGDGSERAEYVNQDYIFNCLRRAHRNINIMYTYYPKDKEWPGRISEVCKDMDIKFQWDYPYDDYFPYGGGIGGSLENEPFNQMRDIRRHGQDVTLTLTIDCSLEDEYLIGIARDLRTFGRMRLRINHECSGDWFTHNRRFSYKEVGEFFVRFGKIVKREAPNVKLVFCGGCIMDLNDPDSRISYEDEFLECYRIADYWSMDCYLALHYGWPYDVCEKDVASFATTPIDIFYRRLELTSRRLEKLLGFRRPLLVSEFNTDGDVTGPKKQGKSVLKFVEKLKESHSEKWFGGFCYYQFRDRGRLGLEIEDPNNSTVGIRQPIMEDYRKIMNDDFFVPKDEIDKDLSLPVKLRWGGAEDAEGMAMRIRLKKAPVFFEMNFEEDLNLIIIVNNSCFYKACKTKTIDLMPAFFDEDFSEERELDICIYGPPADGENKETDGEGWDENSYTIINKLPDLRIRYEAVADI